MRSLILCLAGAALASAATAADLFGPRPGDMTSYETPEFTLVTIDNLQLRRDLRKLPKLKRAMELSLGVDTRPPETPTYVYVVSNQIWVRYLRPSDALNGEFVPTRFANYIVADGSQMSKKQLESWAKSATWHMLSEYTVPGVTTESPHARDLAMKWIRSKKESIASSGWCTYAGIVATKPDDELDIPEIEGLLKVIVKRIHSAPNHVRYAMNGFVIAVGAYVKPLLKHAKQVAKTIGAVSVDMGDTACKVPLASSCIEKIEMAGRIGKKRKTIKC